MNENAHKFLTRLASEGGAIVSTGNCSEIEITDARVRGDSFVDDDGYGFIKRTKEWLDRVHKNDDYMQ